MVKYPKIDITLTTYKRRDLLQKTMESFLNTCLDFDLVNRWLVGDDGSSKEDIKWMKEKYSFLTIYQNSKKGQASNINNIFSKVETDWFFHMEDDWLFLKKDNYIRKLFDIVFDNELIKNATLRFWTGDKKDIRQTPNGTQYFIHNYLPVRPSRVQKRLSEKEKQRIKEADALWCGYTLNPSLQHKETINKLGRYNEEIIFKRNWDRPQAIKYYELGYKRANLMENYIEHIGENNSAYDIRQKGGLIID